MCFLLLKLGTTGSTAAPEGSMLRMNPILAKSICPGAELATSSTQEVEMFSI